MYHVPRIEDYPMELVKIENGQFLIVNSKLIISDGNQTKECCQSRLLGSTKSYPITHVCIKGYVSYDRLSRTCHSNKYCIIDNSCV